MKAFSWIRICAMLMAILTMVTMTVACDGENEPKDTDPGVTTEEPATEAPTEAPTEKETETEAPKPLKLKIASYNIQNGAGAGHDMTKLAKNITNKNIDIVGLQEVDQNVNRSNRIDTMKLLSEATGYKYYAFFKAIETGGGEYGVGILSKYPILSTEKVMLESGTHEQRVLGRAEIDVDGLIVNFFVTHLSYESATVRKTQYQQINNEVLKYDNFILTGDFNTGNFSEYSAIANSGMVNNADFKVTTFPGSNSSIDNIVFSSETWKFGIPYTVTASHSDHYMLYSMGTYIGERP